MKGRHYSVYVVELDPAVLRVRRFAAASPGHDPRKSCYYVGMTGIDPDDRFDNHKRGYKANRYVKKYGLRLVPPLYEEYNPMTFGEAVEKEQGLAGELRRKGHAVWQH